MQTAILIDPKDLDMVQKEIAAASGIIKNQVFEQRDNLDATDIMRLVLDCNNRDALCVFLGILIGKNVRFELDNKGVHIFISGLPVLLKILKAIKNESGKE